MRLQWSWAHAAVVGIYGFCSTHFRAGTWMASFQIEALGLGAWSLLCFLVRSHAAKTFSS